MRSRRASMPLLVLEWALLILGVACAGWYVWNGVQTHRRQDAAARDLARVVVAQPRTVDARPPVIPAAPLITNGGSRTLGQLDIPSIRLWAVVMNSDDDDALGFAVGYLPDSPPPWGSGNSVFAAHRDGLFRPLRNIRAGDDIALTTLHGSLRYRVRRTLVVGPRDVWVLGAVPHVDLTLVTCFPFSWVGHAPQRFIVQAEKVTGR